MECHCLLPACLLCRPAACILAPSQDNCCACFLPHCKVCFSDPAPPLSTQVYSSGRHISAQASAMIATVDARLRSAMRPGAQHSFSQRGEKWKGLDSGCTSSLHESRHDHLVGLLCDVSAPTVRTCRSAFKQAHEDGRVLPAEPMTRGVKRVAEDVGAAPCLVAGPTSVRGGCSAAV